MKKVLIVEDDQIVANIYRTRFSTDGFQVEVALDGSSGLEMARNFRPDAIVLDLMMPKMSGVDFMKQIRAQPDFEQLPVIVFSNTYLTNMVQEAWKAGATRCLSKTSCTPKQVVDVVRNSLSTNGGNTHPNGTGNGTSVAPNLAQSSRPAPDAAGDADAQFQAEIRQEFLDG